MTALISIGIAMVVLIFVVVFDQAKYSTEDKWRIAIGLSIVALVLLYFGFVFTLAAAMSNDPF